MSDSDFVDIEGDEDSFSRKKKRKIMKQEQIEDDLVLTPERGDNNEENEDILIGDVFPGKHSNDSDDDKPPLDVSQQGYSDYYEDSQSYMEAGNQQQYQVKLPQMDDENSFDPSEFFRHSALAVHAAAEEQNQLEDQPVATYLNNDMEVSESESENEEPMETDGAQADDSNEGFDIDEILQ